MVTDWIKRAQAELRHYNIDELKDSGFLAGRGEKFFPVIGYPPLTMYRDMDETPLFSNLAQRRRDPLSAYLHVPFCPTRCTYCHWITKTRSKSSEVDMYIDYLEREMDLYRTKMGVDAIKVKSVLWGGGTPTYPEPKQLERLLSAFHRHFDLSECTQFSVEAEPTTLLGEDGLARLRVMKDYGVDRISLGVQSLDDQVLRTMARAHDHRQTLESIANMRATGFDNIFIDLIYGYPGQTIEQLTAEMLAAVTLDVDGYQLYRLRIKQHGDRPGKIVDQFQRQPDRFVQADAVFLMKYLGILISEEHGYHEYQRRVFARKPHMISHYLRDWCCGLHDVVGVGVSSWSNLGGVFTQNIGEHDLSKYYSYIDAGKVSVNRGKVRDADDELRRSFILPLKNSFVDKARFRARTGKDAGAVFAAELAWFKDNGMIVEDDRRFQLSAKGGFFADEVATQFFNKQYMPFAEVPRVADWVADTA